VAPARRWRREAVTVKEVNASAETPRSAMSAAFTVASAGTAVANVMVELTWKEVPTTVMSAAVTAVPAAARAATRAALMDASAAAS